MAGRARIEDAKRAALCLVEGRGVAAPHHIIVEDLAASEGLIVTLAALVGMKGQLLAPPWRQPTIRVSDQIYDLPSRRFIIAHELGHYVLKHRSPAFADICGPILQPAAERPEETEANVFALEVLMPEPLVREACDLTRASLDPIFQMAYMFGTTLPASALQFTELTDLACAAVLSERGAVTWTACSAAFPMPIAQGKSIDRRALAWDYFEGRTLGPGPRPVPAAAWIDVPELPRIELMEHSIPSHERGTVLTMLWASGERASTGQRMPRYALPR